MLGSLCIVRPDLIQTGTSEKVALVVQFSASFVTGFIIAYVRSWRLALALSSILPCIAITGAIMNTFLSKYMQQSLKHVAEGGSVAEEVISTIRTAQAFGTQSTLSAIYDSHIRQAHTVDLKSAVVTGIALSSFFFVVYSSYALAFQFGTTLIIQGHADIGVVVNVIIAILIGSFSLALLPPEMQGAHVVRIFLTLRLIPSTKLFLMLAAPLRSSGQPLTESLRSILRTRAV